MVAVIVAVPVRLVPAPEPLAVLLGFSGTGGFHLPSIANSGRLPRCLLVAYSHRGSQLLQEAVGLAVASYLVAEMTVFELWLFSNN